MIFYQPKNIIKENKNVISRPIFNLSEVDDVYETVLNDIDNNLTIPSNVLDSFKLKDTLNPKIWENDKLRDDIKKNLIKIGKDFFKSLELPEEIKIKDILFVGSLANYNWSDFSDIDLHVVVDFNLFDESKEFIQKFFDAHKNMYNQEHDITIENYPVELYVQDLNDTLTFPAVYSIASDKWIVKPSKEKIKIDKKSLKNKVEKIFEYFKTIKKDFENENYQSVVDKLDKLKTKLKTMRKAGLEQGGEFSLENLIFKILRRTDFIEILNNYKNKAYDKLMSLEENQP